MGPDFEMALEHLRCAAVGDADCSAASMYPGWDHAQKHMRAMFKLLSLINEAEPPRCTNCERLFEWGDKAYEIQKGQFTGFDPHDNPGFEPWRSGESLELIVLCARCYDNNWVIGEPDDLSSA